MRYDDSLYLENIDNSLYKFILNSLSRSKDDLNNLSYMKSKDCGKNRIKIYKGD